MKRLTISDLTGFTNLDPKYINFVIEYSKDFDARRAALASGFAPDSGYQIRDREDVQEVLQVILQSRLDASHITAEWVLMEAVDNHILARQQGKLTQSNAALNIIARHAAVDAFAAEKVTVKTDEEVVARLLRARKRKQEEVSFI